MKRVACVAAAMTISITMFSGCGRESEPWVERAGGVDTSIEVQIAIRSAPYQPGDLVSEGDFQVVSSHVIPIQSDGGSARVVSVSDGVTMELGWEGLRQLDSRKNQHAPQQTRLTFDNLRLVVDNEIELPSGVKHHVGASPSSFTVTSSFEPILSPLTFSSGTGDEQRSLVIRVRLLAEPPRMKTLEIPKDAGEKIGEGQKDKGAEK